MSPGPCFHMSLPSLRLHPTGHAPWSECTQPYPPARPSRSHVPGRRCDTSCIAEILIVHASDANSCRCRIQGAKPTANTRVPACDIFVPHSQNSSSSTTLLSAPSHGSHLRSPTDLHPRGLEEDINPLAPNANSSMEQVEESSQGPLLTVVVSSRPSLRYTT